MQNIAKPLQENLARSTTHAIHFAGYSIIAVAFFGLWTSVDMVTDPGFSQLKFIQISA